MYPNVIVMMSTYNGSKYIVEQIETIFNQDYLGNINVLIRDDGSSDDTLNVIDKIKIPSNRNIKIYKETNIGPQKSFLKLIEYAEKADFYFFADQDDIWDLDKIRIAVEQMSANRYESLPVVYCSNYRLVNENLNTRVSSAINVTPKFSPLKIIFYNQIPGCTMGFNYALVKLLKKLTLDDVMMHDSMSLSLCSLYGDIIYDSSPRITHRIHGNNVVGEGHKKIIFQKWIVEKIKLLFNKEAYDLSEMAKQFLDLNERINNWEFKEELLLLQNYKKNYKNTFLLLRHPDSNDLFGDRTTMSIRCKILFHLF